MKFFYYLVSKLPIKVLYVFSDFFYVFISRFYRKKVVETNIKNSFPDLSEEQYKKIKKRFYKMPFKFKNSINDFRKPEKNWYNLELEIKKKNVKNS